jgi:hypothetical protein
MDESERYSAGDFTTFESAVAACQEIVDDFLDVNRKERQFSNEELFSQYCIFGPDPFILSDDPSIKNRQFTARGYARERCFPVE